MKVKVNLLFLLILLIPTSLALAKGRQPDKVIITGQGLATPITITDPQTIEILWRMRIHILPNIDKSYAISFFQQDEQGKYTQFYSFNYYPEIACEHGLVFDPSIGNSNQWYFATQEGQATAQRLIQNQDISRPQVQPSLYKEWAPWMVAFGVTLANGFVTFGLLRKKRQK